MKLKILATLLLFSGIAAVGAPLPESLNLQKDGTFSFHGATFQIAVGDARWRFVSNKNWKEQKSRVATTGAQFSGTILPGSGRGVIAESITPTAPESAELHAVLTMQEPVRLNRISGNFVLPANQCAILVDGKAVNVPERPEKARLYAGWSKEVVLRTFGAEELVIRPAGGRVIIQDNRKVSQKNDTVSVMFCFQPEGGEVSRAELKLNMTVRKIAGVPVPLEKFVTRAFREEPGNTLPVWTLQGPEESLYMIRPGTISALGLDFTVSPRGAAAVGGEERGAQPELTIPVQVPAGMRSLNFLHTSAWTPTEKFGELVIRYSDGSESRYPLSGLRDCGNWTGSRNLENAVVAWRGDRADNSVSAYLSTFPLQENRTPVAVTLRATYRQVIWFVLGMTFTPEKILLPSRKNLPTRIAAGADWCRLDFRNETVPGSPLDFLPMLDAPAGKYGFVRPAPDGTLRFEKAPARRLKLYGTNLCQSANFPSKEEAEKIADQIARNGYNSVRFHHHDNSLVDPAAADSTTLNAEMVDRLDFFIAALKKRGIYITTDLFTSRKLKPGDRLPETNPRSTKAWFQSDSAALENWKTFARNWLTHRNPYTGLTLAEEPALVFVNLVNEDDPLVFWNNTLASRERHLQLFEAWKKKNNCPDARADAGDRKFLKFLFELKGNSLAEMARFVKEELKLKAAVTSVNQHQGLHFVPLRDKFDVVDDHGYHDHRSYVKIDGRTVNGHTQSSAIATLSYMPRQMMTSRNPGKPFFMTEFNHCRPNRYRAESGPMMGGYAALQNWDGLYRFCYSHTIERIRKNTIAVSCFESVADPIMQLSDRIIAMLFLRGDVRPAPEVFSMAVPENVLDSWLALNFPLKFQMLGFVTGIGSHVAGRPLPAGVTPVSPGVDFNDVGKNAALWQEMVEKRRAVSATGELKIDAPSGTLAICTPRSESVTLPAGNLSTGGVLSVKDVSTHATIAALSLDGKKLAESRSILLLHLTDISNSEATFFDSDCRFVNSQGKLPLLVRRGSAEVTLKVAPGAPLQVQALSADGDVLGELPVSGNTFPIATDRFPGGVLAWHVTRQE